MLRVRRRLVGNESDMETEKAARKWMENQKRAVWGGQVKGERYKKEGEVRSTRCQRGQIRQGLKNGNRIFFSN